MITTTLGALAAAEESVKAIAALPLPVKTAYAMSKLLAAVAAELEHWHKQRLAWVNELGTANADGLTEVPASALPEFMRRMTELAAIAVDLSAIPITLEMLGETTMTGRDVAALVGAGLLIEHPDGPRLVDTGVSDGTKHKRQLQPTGARR